MLRTIKVSDLKKDMHQVINDLQKGHSFRVIYGKNNKVVGFLSPDESSFAKNKVKNSDKPFFDFGRFALPADSPSPNPSEILKKLRSE